MSSFIRTVPRIRSAVLRSARLQLRTYASSYPPHTVIGMPALSPTMTQGNIAVWNKQVGDKLEPGEAIAEIETDKAQMDFEFQEDGFLAKILEPAGAKDLPVGKPIAVYVEEEGDVAAFKDFKVEETAPAKSEKPAADAKPAEDDKSAKGDKPAKKPSASKQAASGKPAGDRIFASPLAKNIALQHGVALKSVTAPVPTAESPSPTSRSS